MNYAKELIENQKKKQQNIESNLQTLGIFPDRKEPLRKLNLGEELILKITYDLRIAFLEEMTFIFAFCYSKSKFEEIIKHLEAQGYIQTKTSRDYGKYWTLTKTALYYIYKDPNNETDDITFNEDKLPTNTTKLYIPKVINGCFAKEVFYKMTVELWNKYQSEDKDFRRSYAKEQYIKREIFPSQMKKNSYTKKEEAEFVQAFMPQLEYEEEQNNYKRFIALVKANLSDDFVKYAFLKDYYNSHNEGRQKALSSTYQIFKRIFNNIYRSNYHSWRHLLYIMTNKSTKLNYEYQLFYTNEYLKLLNITKKSLTNSSKSKPAEELAVILDKIKDLEAYIKELEQKKKTLEPEFETMLFSRYGAKDESIFEEGLVSFETLRNNNVYITNAVKEENGKFKITFSILQSSNEEPSIYYLFSRIEKIFKFYQLALLAVDYEIKIYCFSSLEAEIIKSKLKTIRENFEQLPEYAMLLLVFDEIQVISTEKHFKERYELFKSLRK